jgi:hypothetical protein
MRHKRTIFSFLTAALFLFFITLPLAAQDKAVKGEHKSKNKEFCSNWNYSSGERVGFNEMREFKIPASGRIEVDGGKNGGVSVKGGDVSEVTVKACVNSWGKTDAEAQAIAKNITISQSGVIRADNSSEENNWGVSFQLTLPRNHDLKLTAKNGGISISGVDGSLEFETVNGGVSLKDVGGDVRGKTTNGGVSVKLTGSGWRGTGLDVLTTNGGVNILLPEGYAANVETGTVNGGYKTDFPALNVERTERWKAVRVNAPINGGGAPLKVITTNGGVTINTYGPESN